ncbi:MAG: pyridoxamine 5'-phosphate oxidase family protein [Bdellovibrionales bacterium]|nr:pyridoxamine 5'-phosphate oxidase family protein [Bdellovibrionales bacterium]
MACVPNILVPTMVQNFVKQSAYGQIATVSDKNILSVRTVHLHFLPENDRFAFNTHIQSQKAQDVLSKGHLSGCYWNETEKIQFRFRAKANLISNSTNDTALLETLWLTMREETRIAYTLDHLDLPYDLSSNELPGVETRPPNHSVILFAPYYWDIHTFDPKGYRFGKRIIYELEGEQWQTEPTTLIY